MGVPMIFWDKATPTVQGVVRALITTVFGLAIIGAAASVVLLVQTPRPASAGGQPHLALWFTSLAVLGASGAAVWLLQYRRD
jgi:hypothetical protein